MVKIAVDAMGATTHRVRSCRCREAAQSREDIQIFLIGKEEVVSEELKKHTYKKEQIEVVNATEVIETGGTAGQCDPHEERIRPSWSA